MTKILVTGATGFLGTNITLLLIDAGYSVRTFGLPGSTTKYIKNHNIENMEGERDKGNLDLGQVSRDVVVAEVAEVAPVVEIGEGTVEVVEVEPSFGNVDCASDVAIPEKIAREEVAQGSVVEVESIGSGEVVVDVPAEREDQMLSPVEDAIRQLEEGNAESFLS